MASPDNDAQYDQYRAELAQRESKMGHPGPNSGDETYAPVEPGSPLAGGDNISKVFRDVERTMGKSNPAMNEPNSAIDFCESSVEKLRAFGDLPVSHPLRDEVNRVICTLNERCRLIKHCMQRYPRLVGGKVELSGDTLQWNGTDLSHNGTAIMSVRRCDHGDALQLTDDAPGGPCTVIDERGRAQREALRKAVDWARGILGRHRLGEGRQWHDGVTMDRHTFLQAAGEWRDLMIWLGADDIIADLFRCVDTDDRADQTA